MKLFRAAVAAGKNRRSADKPRAWRAAIVEELEGRLREAMLDPPQSRRTDGKRARLLGRITLVRMQIEQQWRCPSAVLVLGDLQLEAIAAGGQLNAQRRWRRSGGMACGAEHDLEALAFFRGELQAAQRRL